VDLYSALSLITPLRRSGMASQGISQFLLHTLRTSGNGMNHTCMILIKLSTFMSGFVAKGTLNVYSYFELLIVTRLQKHSNALFQVMTSL